MLHEQRSRIEKLLKGSPSLANRIDEYASETYEMAMERAAIETGLPPARFPLAKPFTKEQLLDWDFVP